MSEQGASSVPADVTPVASASFEASDRHLRRTVPFQSLLFLSMGAIIGSGWLFGSLKAAAVAGPAAVLSWAVGGVFVICISLAWAEIAGMIPRTGAIVRYPSLTHGAYTGWIMGWAYWLSAASVPTIEAEAVVTYLGGRWPQADFVTKVQGQQVLAWPNGILFGLGLMLLFFVLNFFGVRLLSEWNRWFTWWKIVVPVLTFCFLFAAFKGVNYGGPGGFAPMGVAPIFQALATSGVIFAYLGFRQALDYGGEAKNPQRDIPLATIGSIVIAMVIYVLLQIAFIGALNWHAAGLQPYQWAKLAGSPWAAGPLYNALTAANLGALAAFGTVLLIDAGISPSGTGWIYLGTSTRVFYGLSVPGWLPAVFQRMNPWGIPWPSVVGALVVGCVFFVPAPSWYILVGFITSTTVLTYIMGGVALPVLRRFAPDMPRPFRLGAAWFWAPVGFLAALMIVYWSGFSTLDNVFAAVMVGLPLFAWFFAWGRGWADRRLLVVLGVVFLAAWIYVNHMGGWTLNAGSKVLPGSWSFPIYDVAFSAAVLFFCIGLWALCNQEGRRHVQRSAWLIFLILATFPLSYWGEYGPLPNPALGFPWGTLVEVGVGIVAYVWGAFSGFATEELKEIVSAAGQRIGSGPLPLAPRAPAPSGQSAG
ncbi:MAG TPA: APC family permease [Candidatus Dormibacteraeota bacterium]|nr:APC family permease [Candidatus Dormibacteraeota bacterium]